MVVYLHSTATVTVITHEGMATNVRHRIFFGAPTPRQVIEDIKNGLLDQPYEKSMRWTTEEVVIRKGTAVPVPVALSSEEFEASFADVENVAMGDIGDTTFESISGDNGMSPTAAATLAMALSKPLSSTSRQGPPTPEDSFTPSPCYLPNYTFSLERLVSIQDLPLSKVIKPSISRSSASFDVLALVVDVTPTRDITLKSGSTARMGKITICDPGNADRSDASLFMDTQSQSPMDMPLLEVTVWGDFAESWLEDNYPFPLMSGDVIYMSHLSLTRFRDRVSAKLNRYHSQCTLLYRMDGRAEGTEYQPILGSQDTIMDVRALMVQRVVDYARCVL